MTADPHKALVIGVGALEGLGASIARRMAREGLHVFVAGRTRNRLDEVVAAIAADGGRASAVATDATDEASVSAAFDAACAGPGALQLTVFNAGNMATGKIADMEARFFEAAWRIGCYGGFLAGREAARRMLPAGGTLIFTGASASLRGKAGFGAFASSKGALRNLAQALARECGPAGLHVAHVVVDGGIDGDMLRTRLPDYAREAGERLLDRDAIADAYWYLHRQPPRAWTFELDLRSRNEPW
ncbi:MAG TPA: SDR family NAD(P)-dependent oxidoreductase [Gammaproteobacteria bacterium]|nr:SDR family NAD(P)-dependent oxidoreductase [Gammaproteobacteria bacterium]